MTIRAKFTLSSVTHHNAAGTSRTFRFYPQYDLSVPEDQRFAKASPSGSLDIMVDNPAVFEHFEIGRAYYLDFIPAAPSEEQQRSAA